MPRTRARGQAVEDELPQAVEDELPGEDELPPELLDGPEPWRACGPLVGKWATLGETIVKFQFMIHPEENEGNALWRLIEKMGTRRQFYDLEAPDIVSKALTVEDARLLAAEVKRTDPNEDAIDKALEAIEQQQNDVAKDEAEVLETQMEVEQTEQQQDEVPKVTQDDEQPHDDEVMEDAVVEQQLEDEVVEQEEDEVAEQQEEDVAKPQEEEEVVKPQGEEVPKVSPSVPKKVKVRGPKVTPPSSLPKKRKGLPIPRVMESAVKTRMRAKEAKRTRLQRLPNRVPINYRE